MVTSPPNSSAPSGDIKSLLDSVSRIFAPAEVDTIRNACEIARALYQGQTEVTGVPLLQHALGTAAILAGMSMDSESITAGILHAVPEHLDDWQEKIGKDFGANVNLLVEGISRMRLEHVTDGATGHSTRRANYTRQVAGYGEASRLQEQPRGSPSRTKGLRPTVSGLRQIGQFSETPSQGKKNRGEAARQIESLRKMLLAMVEDIRVVLIKLAERTEIMRHLSGASKEQQKLIALKTRTIFAPLANRLGVWQLKWELEDLSVRYLEPELYRKVAKLLDERRIDREQYIADVVSKLKQALSRAGIPAEVTGRPKHIYSIINKMKRKGLDFSELYDVRAVRILVGDVTRRDEVSGAGMSPSASSRNRLLRSNVSEADDMARRDEVSDETTSHSTKPSKNADQVAGYGAGMSPSAASRNRLFCSNVSESNDSLVDGIRGCYTALGLVHELWPPIESEFDDYIAHPKSNNYRSLHTAVSGPRGLALEVQIRTREMHQHSELGFAAHWRYKEGMKSDSRFDEKIAWLRQILEWKEDLADRGDLQEQFRSGLFHDRVYVLTPLGKVIDLPKGATPVEFAYTLHTDLGHRTRGAKIDGNIVPLNYKLLNGQRVEILTVKQGGPSRDWINPSLGYLQSPRIRAKVRAWFKSQNFDDSAAQGRMQLDRELHRLGVTAINQEKLAHRLHYNKLEDFLAAIGRSEITQRRIVVAIQEELPAKVIETAPAKTFRNSNRRTQKADITVGGVNNLMTRVAKCCNPAPGDRIVGYVTRDRGITIHRENCAFMLRMTGKKSDRKLTAQWSEKQ